MGNISKINVIGESSSTRTEWTLVEGDKVIEHAFTEGLNPFFHSRREISHSIRLELPEAFFKRRWNHVYYYGAGCSNPEKNKIVEASLVAQFKTPVTVMSDLLGAARALCGHAEGIACVLGTGSNSCLYDGKETDGLKGTVYLQIPSSDNERGQGMDETMVANQDLIKYRFTEGDKTVGALNMKVDSRHIVLTLLDRTGQVLDSVEVKAKR